MRERSGSSVRILRVLEALGGSSVRILRVLEALGAPFVCILRVWEAPGGARFPGLKRPSGSPS